MKRQPLLVACTVAALAAAGCSGGGSQMTPAGNATTQSQSGKATLSITIPSKPSKTSTGARTPQYVSPNTNSASFAVAGGAAQVVDLSSSSSACTPATGDGRTCTATITAPVGTGESLVIKTFASSDGTGDALTNNTESIDVTQGGPNNFSFTLNGVLASIQVAVSPDNVTISEATDLTASLTPLDASGATIIGNPVGPDGGDISGTPTLSASPATGFTIDPFNDTTDSFAVHYDGSSTTSPVTLTASVTGYPSADATVTVNGAPTPPPGISNGDFASGALTNSQGFGWTSCSIAHATLTAPVNASPAPKSTPPQTTATTAISPANTVAVGSLPTNLNENHTSDLAPAAAYAALTGDVANETEGASGICQTFQVPSDASATQLTFWVYELGGEYNFKYADQEAAILDSTGTTIDQQLFAELSCFQDPTVFTTQTPATTSGCWPASMGGDSNGHNDWQGGYWVQRGPYDLSSYVGDTITLFIGVWSDEADTSGKYGNAMYVTDVQLQAAASGSVTINGRSHR